MKLLTEALKKKIPPFYSQENIDDPKAVVKFFTPDSNWTWFCIEGQEIENGDWKFFGLVQGFEEELGYFLLSELESAKGPWGLSIERDIHFTPTPLSRIRGRGYEEEEMPEEEIPN
jgi:hypothetical protein